MDGKIMYNWLCDLFPITRSIMGPGVRETLAYLKTLLPQLQVHSVPSGTQAFDWSVPDEWTVNDAWIKNKAGDKVVDFRKNNLHIVSYSMAIDKWMPIDELRKHLYTNPKMADAIPYVTSYYSRSWGFCISHNAYKNLKQGCYHVFIDAEHKSGVLNYGELILPGRCKNEIFLSTYICHPSMANNELSGPVVTAALAKWLSSIKSRKYTYRIIFIPETIGSIVYISQNLENLKKNIIAGYNVTCVGDERCYSYLPSRNGNTLSDQIAKHVLEYIDPSFKCYTWLDNGSDERQYCSPGVDLPIATIMRSKYGTYPEYHTSLDDLSFVTPAGLEGGYEALRRCLEILENNNTYGKTVLCEPQMSKRGLYPSTSSNHKLDIDINTMMMLMSYCDGSMSVLDIAELIKINFFTLNHAKDILEKHNLLKVIY